MRKTIFLAFCTMALLVACNKDNLQPNGFASTQYGNTATVKMSNSWWVNVSLPGTGNLTPLPVLFETYNTAQNKTDSMWLDDLGNLGLAYAVGFPGSLGMGPDSLAGLGVDIKCKVAINYTAFTFSTANSVNYYGDSATTLVTVFGGKILPMAGHSLSGNAVDSIMMKAVFSNAPNPTDTFTIAGVARTGLNADDY
jgi:hypothetical protein